MLLIASIIISSGLYAQCGPSVSPVTTAAIVQVESGGNPFAVADNTTRKSYAPSSKIEAITLASTLLSAGHNLDLGLMQINSVHLKSMRLNVGELFDPCSNVKAGTRILAFYYRVHDTVPDKNQVLFKALSSYNTGSAWRGPGYVNKILAQVNAPYRVKVIGAKPASSSKPRRHIAPTRKAPPKSSLFFDADSVVYPDVR